MLKGRSTFVLGVVSLNIRKNPLYYILSRVSRIMILHRELFWAVLLYHISMNLCAANRQTANGQAQLLFRIKQGGYTLYFNMKLISRLILRKRLNKAKTVVLKRIPKKDN